MAHPPIPKPKSLLGRHRLLSPTASVRVSPICLGGMSLGNAWKSIMDECTKESAFELLDYFYDQGGNFVDTANVYQKGESEQWIGEWMEKTGRRDEMVISTKYYLDASPSPQAIKSNYGGTGTKSMYVSFEQSLKNLNTNYVDLFFVHNWDYSTSIPELMQSLNHLVEQRKVLYLGISNTPAWVVVEANCYAREHGLRQFSVYQGRYAAQARDAERDIIPMCQHEGMALHAWGVMGHGYFKSPDQVKEGGRQAPFMLTGQEEKVSAVLDGVAKRLSVPVTSVALAYVMHKAPYTFPILGGRKISNLKANIEALGLRLSPTDMEEIDKAYGFDTGFPHYFINMAGGMARGPEDAFTLRSMGHFDHVRVPQPIQPHYEEAST